MGMDDLVADEFLGTIPVAFGDCRSQPFLIDFAAAETDIFAVMRIAKNVGQKQFVRFDRFFGAIRYRRGYESCDISIFEGLSDLAGALGDLADTLGNVTRRAAAGQ